jgi:hypothetical protein
MLWCERDHDHNTKLTSGLALEAYIDGIVPKEYHAHEAVADASIGLRSAPT